MFDKSKRKIVFAIVFSLLALMIVTLTTIYLSNRLSILRENKEMLKTYAEHYVLDAQPDAPKDDINGEMPPEPPEGKKNGRNEPVFKLSTFYSVTYAKTGEVLAVNNGNNALQSDEELLSIAATVLKKGRNSGTVGAMTYLIDEKDDYTLVAMIDGTINDKNQKMLFQLMLIIGSVSVAVLFVISVFIARRIVRPLEENDKKQKRFVSDAGHELKTPIAVISANSELLRREIGENEWLNNIDYENERMNELIKQLLILSRADGGNVQKEALDFSRLVAGETLPFESLAFEKGKKIESDVETGLTLSGNASQLRQLVSILLDNALSHGKGEAVALSLKSEKHSIVLSVVNDAEEMSPEQVSHLFDRFYRTDESRNESGSHYGLGLSIAKAVAEAHEGTIRAEYRNGKITFTVVFPNKKHN